jgi:hypothetical protein
MNKYVVSKYIVHKYYKKIKIKNGTSKYVLRITSVNEMK